MWDWRNTHSTMGLRFGGLQSASTQTGAGGPYWGPLSGVLEFLRPTRAFKRTSPQSKPHPNNVHGDHLVSMPAACLLFLLLQCGLKFTATKSRRAGCCTKSYMALRPSTQQMHNLKFHNEFMPRRTRLQAYKKHGPLEGANR